MKILGRFCRNAGSCAGTAEGNRYRQPDSPQGEAHPVKPNLYEGWEERFFSFALGTALYALVPYTGAIDSVALFVLCYAVIFSMYGGGFATVPAYLRDMFGTRYVGAIHGLVIDRVVDGRDLRTRVGELYTQV